MDQQGREGKSSKGTIAYSDSVDQHWNTAESNQQFMHQDNWDAEHKSYTYYDEHLEILQ